MGVSRRAQEATGKVVPFAGTGVPYGWLRCNGQAVSRASYAALWAFMGLPNTGDGATTFNVPEMRGEVLRGLDEGRGVDAGRVLGSAQAHQSNNLAEVNMANVNGGASLTATGIMDEGGAWSPYVTSGDEGADPNWSHRFRLHGRETRPQNVAFPYCIKT